MAVQLRLTRILEADTNTTRTLFWFITYAHKGFRDYTMTATNHDGRSNENMIKKLTARFKKNRQIQDIVGNISTKLWSSLFVVVVMVCGRQIFRQKICIQMTFCQVSI